MQAEDDKIYVICGQDEPLCLYEAERFHFCRFATQTLKYTADKRNCQNMKIYADNFEKQEYMNNTNHNLADFSYKKHKMSVLDVFYICPK